MRKFIHGVYLVLFCLPSSLSFADITCLPAQSLEDQWGQPHQLDDSIQLVIVSYHKEGGDWVKAFISNLPPDAQSISGWLYIADIHKMPGFITRMIALPRMRDYSFPVSLIRDSETLSGWPRQEDAVTVIELNHLKISRVSYLTDVTALHAQLQAQWPHH